MQLEIVTPPAVQPVTLNEAKRQARVWLDLTDDDDLIAGYIASAVQLIETDTARAFIDRTLKETRFTIPSDGRIRLLRAPVSEVLSVEVDGEPIAFALKSGTPGWLVLPTSTGSEVVITYVAGYGEDAASVPDLAKLAVKMLVAHWYATREPIITGTIVAEVPFAAKAFANSLRWGGEVPR